LKLQAINEMELVTPTQSGRLAPVESVGAGGVVLSHTFALLLDFSKNSAEMGIPSASGIVGMDLLGRGPVTIDYAAATLTLHERSQFKEGRRLSAPAFPLTFTKMLPMVECTIHGRLRGTMLLDTGKLDALNVSNTFMRHNHAHFTERPGRPALQRTFEGLQKLLLTRLTDVSVFGETFAWPAVSLSLEESEEIRGHRAGIVGAELLRHFRLTMDANAGKIWCVRNASPRLKEWDEPGFDAKAADIMGITPLMRAAHDGLIEDVKRFLKSGAMIDAAESARGTTALMMAAAAGHVDVMKVLLDAGADREKLDKRGRSALLVALDEQQSAAAICLLQAKVKVDVEDSGKYTALTLACRNGDKAAVELLLKLHAKVEASDANSYSPMHVASVLNRKEIVELLIDAGAGVNVKDDNWITPLMMACQGGAKETAELLIKRGAKIELADRKGNTVLHHAARGRNAAVVQMLLQVGADRQHKNNSRETAFDVAVPEADISVMSVLYGWSR